MFIRKTLNCKVNPILRKTEFAKVRFLFLPETDKENFAVGKVVELIMSRL